MKVRNYLESIAGVGIYPVITLLIFFIFFSILSFWVIRSRRSQFDAQSALPLEGPADAAFSLHTDSSDHAKVV